ncbi:MAG TPA: hypothetical protein VKB05_07900 [Pyrinomonadaceae bacterium]|nr:hypothetical protein [Pyrinomonadaceae bacterium]
MNTQLNLKTWQRLFGPSFVTLLIGVLAVLVLGGPSVQAQTTTASDAPVDSSITLVVKGSVTDPNGTITVSGNVIITCKRVIDTTSVTSPSLVLLDFDFSQVKGTSGTKTLKTYVTGDNHATEIRPLQASDTIIIPTPYYDSGKDALSARTMLVSANLNFDIASGKLTSGSLSVGNNVVTSSAVGTVSTAPIQ